MQSKKVSKNLPAFIYAQIFIAQKNLLLEGVALENGDPRVGGHRAKWT